MKDKHATPDLHVVGGTSEEGAIVPPAGQFEGSADGNPAWNTRKDWLEEGRRLGARIERDRWALGDWGCHGKRAYGDLGAVAVDIGIAAKTLSNLVSVARKVETSRRREVLSWDHHAAVAALPADIGDTLLARAEAEGGECPASS